MKIAKKLVACESYLFVLFVMASLSLRSAPWEIDKSMADVDFWASDPMLLMNERGKIGFAFTSAEKNAADCRLDGAVTCFGIGVYESVLRFGDENGVESVELSLYNNGGVETIVEKDFGDGSKVRKRGRNDRVLSRDEFIGICKAVSEKLTAAGQKTPKSTDGTMRTAEMTVKEMVWKRSVFGGLAKLTWSYRQRGKDVDSFKPGYIKLVVFSPSGGEVKDVGKKVAAKGSGKITDNIVSDSRGKFLDNVPMVDQGMKGYCAVATSERVLKYYGVDVDEHEIAQLAGTSADWGTSTRAMKDAIERIGKKYRLGTVVCFGDFDDDVSARIDGLNREVDNYNKAAKKLKAKPITNDVYIRQEGNVTHYDISAVDKAMEAKVLVEMKTHGAQAAGYKKFQKSIRERIDKGIPLFWGVKLGIASEPEIPQTMGYHMRLIIGYNDKKNEIIYTDSWGAGHEFKKMRSDWAWTITKSLIYMKPLTR